MIAAVFCPCSEPIEAGAEIDPLKLQLDSYPHTITDKNTHHLLSYLNFCEHCQSVKCRKCIEPEVVVKYCPKCFLEMKPEYSFCSRNCFDCPICDSNISIHQSKNVRNYKMKCTQCDWNWETGELEKPRALVRVVKSQINQTHEMQKFSKLETYYIQRKQLSLGKFEITKNMTMQMSKLQLSEEKQTDLDALLKKDTITKFNRGEDQENVKFLAEQTSNLSIMNFKQSMKSTINSKSRSNIPPNPTRLITKTSKKCKGCRNTLMKPDKEIISSKFYKLSNAIDFLPTIQIHQSEIDHRYLLSFQNPQEVSMNLTVSSYSTIPGTNHKIHLPISEISLGAKPELSSKMEGFVKTIPTVLLSRDTKIGRVELMNRAKVNFEHDVKEHGVNWCVIPLNIQPDTSTNEENQRNLINIPIFITVKTEFYGSGYWCVLRVERIHNNTSED